MRNLSRVDAPRRQLHVGTENDDQVLSTMTTIPEGSVPVVSADGESREGGETPLRTPSPPGDLERTTPKRRSL